MTFGKVTGMGMERITPDTLRRVMGMVENTQELVPAEPPPTADCDNCGPNPYERHNESRHRMRLCENCAREIAFTDTEETE